MKKVYNLIAAAAMFVAGVASASARYWTYDGATPVNNAENVQANTLYAFQPGYSAADGSTWFLGGQRFTQSANLTTGNLFKFVPVEGGLKDKAGAPVYYIQRHSGEYLATPTNGQFFTSTTDRAWKVVVKTAVYKNPEDTYTATLKNKAGEDSTATYKGIQAIIEKAKAEHDETLALNTISFNEQANSGAITISSYESKDVSKDPYSEYVFFISNNKGVAQGVADKNTEYTRNAWVLYTASEQTALNAYKAVFAEVSGGVDLVDKLKNYKLGTGAGEYSKAKYDELMVLWNEYKQVDAGTLTLTDAQYDAQADSFPKAYAAFTTSGVGLTAGYYILTNWRSENQNGYDGGALYDGTAVNSSDKQLRWTYKGENKVTYTAPDAANPKPLTYQEAKFIWKVTADPKNEGLFFFQNLETENYIGTQDRLYQPIKMTANAEVSYTIKANPRQPGFFSFYSPTLVKSPGAEMSGVHAAGDVNNVVPWDWTSDPSSWHVRTITEAEVNALRAAMAQPKRNNDLSQLVEKAETAIANGYSYAGYDESGNKIASSTTGDITAVDGLVTSADKFACPMADIDEGKNTGDLVDSKSNTYFHSSWHNGANAWTGSHFLQMELSKAENELLIKWAKRVIGNNVNNNGAPAKVVLWGTNDASKLEVNKKDETNAAGETVTNFNAWKTDWDSLTTSTFTYPYELAVTGSETKIANGVGSAYFKFATPYKYVRLEVVTRVSDGDVPNGNKYFHGSEVRVYKGGFDATTSLIASVPKEVVDKLQAELKVAQQQVKDAAATDEQIAKLKAAYEEFMKNYPDPSRVKTALTAARELVKAAEEGTDMGYYAAGSKTALEAVINKVQADLDKIVAVQPPTVAQINTLLANLNSGLAAFEAALKQPTNGYYMIQSNSSNETVFGRKLFAGNSSREDYVGISGRIKNDAGKYEDDNNFKSKLGAYWYVEKVDTGYTYKNVFTGLYLAPLKGKSVMTQSETPYVFTLRFAKTAGCFNIVLSKNDADGNNIFANAQPGTGHLVTWNAASGKDNSAFQFVAADPTEITKLLEDGFSYDLQSTTNAQIMTFPVVIEKPNNFYTVIGQDANHNIQLKKHVGDLEAGQAYVYVPETGNTDKFIQLYTKARTLADLAPIHKEAAAVNGLVPTFETIKIAENNGKFNSDHSKVLLSEKDEKVPANTGYFSKLPTTTETGDAQIAANGTITGINALIFNNAKAAAKGIYTISGIRLNSTKNLPAGIYIVNGKKQVVK